MDLFDEKSSKNDLRQSGYRTELGKIWKEEGTNSYNKVASSLLWWLVWPAAAVITTDVWWFFNMTENENLHLLSLNVAGAMMEGFFATWESGTIIPHSTYTALMERLADNVRAFFLSTFTSWAGMVGFATTIAYKHGSIVWGLLYMILSVSLGFLAHGLGGSIAKFISNREKPTTVLFQRRVRSLAGTVLIALIIYIVLSYALVVAHVRKLSDVFASTRYFFSAGIDDWRLLVAVICSIAGAYTGNLVGNAVDSRFGAWGHLYMGTLFCNTIFTLLTVILPILTIRQPAVWKDSLWLDQFTKSFCGAASAFAGHISDLRLLWEKDNPERAVQNAIANLTISFVVLFIAMELERLISKDNDESRLYEGNEL